MTNSHLSPEAIRHELTTILSTSELKNSIVLSKFLEFVVTEKLAAHDEQIKEYTIGVQAIGRPLDFNPQIDATVRIHAGRFRKVLNEYYGHQGKEDEIVISIPKGTYVPVFESRKKLVDEKTDDRKAADENKAATKPWAGKYMYKRPVLAVLPFQNLGSENPRDVLVTGMADRLNTELAKFQNIKVVSYYATNKYDKAVDFKELRRQEVDYVLTGSTRIIAQVVRLGLQLVVTDDGEIIWSEHYEWRFNEDKPFEIEEDLLTKVLNKLADENGIILRSRLKAAIHEGRQLSDIEEAVYQYYEFNSDFEPAKFTTTLTALRNANLMYPDFPLVSAQLSGLYLNIFSVTPEHDSKLLDEATQLAQAAVTYDGYLQEGRKALAWAYLYVGNKERCREEIEKCIEINPKAGTAVSTMALAYVCLGEYEEGLKWLVHTENLTHPSPVCTQLGYAIYYYSTGDFGQSLQLLHRLNTLQFPFFLLLQHSIEGHLGIPPTAGTEYMRKLNGDSETIITRFIHDKHLRIKIRDGLNQYQQIAVG